MFAARDTDRPDEDVMSDRFPSGDPSCGPIETYAYRPSGSSRIFGGLATIAVGSLIAAGFLVALNQIDRPKTVSAPLTVSLLPVASPRRAEPKAATQKPVREKVIRPRPREAEPVARPLIPLPSAQAPAAAPPQRAAADPIPQAAATPAPAPPAAPAQIQSRHAPDKWEGRVLARLERYRHYPGDAHHARMQGTAYIRFRIDRNGHVVSSALERSSGYAALDAAAMETLRRSDPLPRIPPDRPDQVELLVPIEFFITQ